MRTWIGRIGSLSLIALGGCGGMASQPAAGNHQTPIVSGAGFTTFDATQGGCKDSPNGIDCNNYVSKADVYMSGGPNAAGLSDGWYFFAVLDPGKQNGGFIEGATGNLSDQVIGGTVGDNGTGDQRTNRRFHVSGHEIDNYPGTHHVGTAPNGRTIIQLIPYDDTDNPGGVYILAICTWNATSPSQCKYDAFRVKTSTPVTPDGGTPPCDTPSSVSGMKYYDSNLDGAWEANEAGIPGWQIVYEGGTITTDSEGDFALTFDLDPHDFTFAEVLPTNTVTLMNGTVIPLWYQSGNVLDQTIVSGNATESLSNYVYSVHLECNSSVDGLYFGNFCIGAGHAYTLGFWSNKNGQAILNKNTAAWVTLLDGLNLRNADGSNFDPTTYSQLRTWLLNGTATNMAYMLSVQLATMELNVAFGGTDGNALVYAPGTTSANSLGFATIYSLMSEANSELGLHGVTLSGSAFRDYQEALKNALDNANNNLTFVQASAATCAGPVYPLPPI